ncbi:metallophosphoesterase family protein [Desertivirga arenae]|uniref:metallophosphoesterase family protein n=1 Tax=Desertivirga arenae TaxID=2810309 RepID=UPI001A96833D|nr:exonuclease SbcCD subunit D [Pedobacter sp. SYSU D00823]
MKILHTADWHLGKRLEKFSRLEEQKEVLAEIIEIADANDVDAVLVAGDLFDSFNPSTEAIELLYKTLKRLTNNGQRAVVAIAGNHDSPDRIEAPDPLARECGIIFAGYPDSHVSTCELDSGVCVLQSEAGFIELKLPRHHTPLRVLLTPYANEYRLKTFLGLENSEEELRQVLQKRWKELADKYCDDKGVNILITHLFMMKKGEEPPEEPEDEKPILHVGGAQAVYSENIPAQIQYTALGHLHGFRVMDTTPCPVVYSSSPLSYSFGEAGHKKYVVLVDAEPGMPVMYKGVQLSKGKPLLRKRCMGVDEALQWLSDNPDALVELTLVTDNYLTADERRRLTQSHEGIVTIIPEVRNPEMLHAKGASIDLSQDIEELFGQFFQHRHGQLPNVELINLFKEIRAEQSEE